MFMEYVIKDREPQSLFHYFEEICAIPHPSYHEERIADYLEAFASARRLECYRDAKHNVLIKKGASMGYEDHAPILLQGHTDMVCEKNGDVTHDFMKDPLKLFLDGDLLGARGTTLGGDDGIAVAIMLAILDGALMEHPPIECLFTVSEEVGLDGAISFDYEKISARRMLNLDSELLGVVTAGCAGGLHSKLTLPIQRGCTEGEGICISLRGLSGGHSGCDIHRGRANANKLMGRILAALDGAFEIRIASIEGGSKDNAIPRECTAKVTVPSFAAAKEKIESIASAIASELNEDDRDFSVECRVSDVDQVLSREDTLRVIAILCAVQNGVLAMHREIDGLVEYSRNLGVIRTEEDRISFVISSRSSMESRLDGTVDELNALARALGCTVSHGGRYPGWEYAPVSPIRELYLNALREVTGKDGTVDVIHAGLECGVIYSKLPDMDMISIGPTMHDIHSPAERLDLSSVEIFWKTLELVIKLL